MSSHHIQDYHFCARVNARCNTLRDWHMKALDADALAAVIDRLVRTPGDAQFASNHDVNDPFEFREAAESQLRSIVPAREAKTLEALAEVFQRPLAEFLRLNPDHAADEIIAPATRVLVPDPGLVPLLAVHLGARVLAQPALDGRKPALIRALIPAAAVNSTLLDTLLSYLLIASQVVDQQLADELTAEAGLVAFGNSPVPFGLIGPDSVMPA